MSRTASDAITIEADSHDLSNRIRSFNGLFTARGVIVLLFLTWLIIGPSLQESDIVATVIAYSLVFLLILFLVVTTFTGLRLKRKLAISMNASFHGESGVTPVLSNSPTIVSLSLSDSGIPPFYLLDFHISFKHATEPSINYRITGATRDARILTQQVRFPHRGIWAVENASVTFGDQFGFTIFHWKIPGELISSGFTVHPPQRASTSLPIMSSCHRPGDLLSDIKNRHGDPFDIKRYQPSDGMRKILWKVYARRRELLARHPEPSMTPEGQVVLFALAGIGDDELCALLLAYMRKLDELNLQAFLGCDGMMADGSSLPEDAEELLIESVWNTIGSSSKETISDIDRFMSFCRGQLSRQGDSSGGEYSEVRIDRVVVFASSTRLCTQSGFQMVFDSCRHFSEQNVTPVVVIYKDLAAGSNSFPNPPGTAGLLLKLFYIAEPKTTSLTPGLFEEFLGICLSRNWEVIIEE